MNETTDDMLARRERLLGPAYRLFYDEPVCLLRSVLTGVIGPDRNILKLRPPTVLARAAADFMLGRLDEALHNTGRST